VHPLLHQSDFYLKRGDGERAAGVQEAAVGRLAELDDSPEWRSIPIYNLACYDALCGQSEKALDWLREALALNPGFVEWSRQDPDLESLRGLPGYQAIYSSG
jgi:tetratricopeptide (TPR) repeat protein